MKRIGVFAAIALGLMWTHTFAFAEPATQQGASPTAGTASVLPVGAENAAKQKLINTREAITSIRSLIEAQCTYEPPRLETHPRGHLRFFGTPPGVSIPLRQSSGVANFETAAVNFINDHGPAFGHHGTDASLQPVGTQTGGDGAHVRLRQLYRGVPVFGAEVIVHLNAQGVTTVVSDLMTQTGRLQKGDLVLTPTLSPAEGAERGCTIAAEISLVNRQFSDAMAAANTAQSAGENSPEALKAVFCAHGPQRDADGNVIISPDELAALRAELQPKAEAAPALMLFAPEILGRPGPVRLAWVLNVVCGGAASNSRTVIVDAHSGEAIISYPLVDEIARMVYDGENQTYNLNTLPPYVEGEDPDDPDIQPPGSVVREEGQAPTSDPSNPHTQGVEVPYADAAYDYLGSAYDFFYDHFGRLGWDGADGRLKAYVQLNVQQNDNLVGSPAYWSRTNAILLQPYAWGSTFVVDDAIGHEYTHAVQRFERQHVYFGESGAIAESFSDVFGEFIDLTNGMGRDQSLDRYYIGEELGAVLVWVYGFRLTANTLLPAPGFRYMLDPPAISSRTSDGGFHPSPDRYFSPYFARDGELFGDGGAHLNVGVGNKLAYLLTEGGTFNGHYVAPMGIDTVAALFYHALVEDLLPAAAEYRDLGSALTQSAVDLQWPAIDRANLGVACDAVEIDEPKAFSIEVDNGLAVAQVFPDGKLVLAYGSVHAEAAASELAEHADVKEFIVKRGADNLLRVEGTTGQMYIKGRLFESISIVGAIPPKSLRINYAGETVGFVTSEAYIDLILGNVPAGSLVLEGHVYDATQ